MLHVKIIVSFGTSGRGNGMLGPTVEPPLTVISLQWPLFWRTVQYIDSRLNLSTTATFFRRQGGR